MQGDKLTIAIVEEMREQLNRISSNRPMFAILISRPGSNPPLIPVATNLQTGHSLALDHQCQRIHARCQG